MRRINITVLGKSLAAAAFALLLSTSAFSDVIYEFTSDASPFDPNQGIGASETLLDSVFGINVTLTTLDIIGQDGSRASEGTNHTTNVNGSTNSMGINDATNPGGYSTEFQDFNPGEGWVFSFDVDVRLVEIDLASQGAEAQMTLSSSAFASFILDDGQVNDIHDLGNVLVPAGTPITAQMTSGPTAADLSIRIDDITVAAIPEPASLVLVLIGAAAFVARRARA
jgi:hypothetical protein